LEKDPGRNKESCSLTERERECWGQGERKRETDYRGNKKGRLEFTE
jgi:hypothetical protein